MVAEEGESKTCPRIREHLTEFATIHGPDMRYFAHEIIPAIGT